MHIQYQKIFEKDPDIGNFIGRFGTCQNVSPTNFHELVNSIEHKCIIKKRRNINDKIVQCLYISKGGNFKSDRNKRKQLSDPDRTS